MRSFLIALVACGLTILASATAKVVSRHPDADVADVWSASRSERDAIKGLESDLRAMDAWIAPVVTDGALRSRIVQGLGARWLAFDAGNQALMKDAAKHHGLPLGLRCYFRPDLVAWVATSSE